MAGSDAVCLRELTASLTAEHRELEQRWRALRRRLERVARRRASTLGGRRSTMASSQLYERHIAREEAELLPMAGRLLSDAELDRIGMSMRHRRQSAIVAVRVVSLRLCRTGVPHGGHEAPTGLEHGLTDNMPLGRRGRFRSNAG
jgi:hypothetical protein